MRPRLLILGAGGFLGRSIVDHLAATDAAEMVLHSRNTEDRAGFDGWPETCMLDLLESSIGSIIDMIDDVQPDAIINCTGLATGDAAAMRSANVHVVIRLIAELEQCPPVHLVHLGSAAEYGTDNGGDPIGEDVAATPIGVYGVTKLAATERLMEAVAEGRISATVLRIFNPVGRFSPASTLPGMAARTVAAALATNARRIELGALAAWRDYVDTRDVADAVLLAATAPSVRRVLNVGRAEAVSTRDLVHMLAGIAGYSGEIVETDHASARSSCVHRQCADISTTRRSLGWSPRRTIREALEALWAQAAAHSTESVDPAAVAAVTRV